MFAVIAAVATFAMAGPDIPKLPPVTRAPQITYLDQSGAVIGVRGGQFAPPVNIAALPAYVPGAFVAIEDRRFYDHTGFDPVGMARAVVKDVTQGKREGASTITQQLARNLFLTNDQTVERKTKELFYSVQIEQTYSKPQILGLYLSRVNFGSGAWGLEAAARRYFNKPANKLTVREAAMLAAIMKSPTNYNPAANPKENTERTVLVLDAMVETGVITPAQRAKALAEKPKVWAKSPLAPAQYFVDWVDGQTRALLTGPLKQDLVVETTLDMAMEAAAADAASATVARYAGQKASQAAVVAVDGTGKVKVMVGGIDYVSAPYNRAALAKRQPGSAWKPFVYLTALEGGLTPDVMVVDEPLTIGTWSPRNYEDGFSGPMTVERAFATSVNTVAARLADQVGRDNVAATARRVGIVSPVNTDPAMALGTSLVTPLEMAQAYASFANGGDRVGAYGIERIRVGNQVIYNRGPVAVAPAIGNPALSELQQMMRAVVTTGTGTRANVAGYDIAGKTGTTTDYKDAWFCGYTGGLAAVVWMGRDDNTPMARMTGGTAPAEAWRAFMSQALKRNGARAIPPGRPAPPPPAAPLLLPPSGNPINTLLQPAA